MKQEMVGEVPGNVLGMLADLAHKLQHGVIAPEELGRFLKKENPFAMRYPDLISDWQNFYRDVFKIEADFSNLRIPKQRKGFDRLLVIVQGLKIQQVYDKCKELFPCWRWVKRSLDEAVTENDRNSDSGAYAIWIRDRVEADEELKNKSANDLKEEKIAGITLLERFVYELKYFKETGGHLDIKNFTLCAGSRYDDSHVPFVSWFDSKMNVYWCLPGNADGDLRSRQVVS